MTDSVNQAEASELRIYANNTRNIYTHKAAIELNLARKIARSVYDPAQAPKLWRYLADNAARAYRREFNMVGGFSPATRQAVADSFARDFDATVAARLAGDLTEAAAAVLAPLWAED